MSEWKPIETAPRGSFSHPKKRVLLYIEGAGIAFGRCYDDLSGGVIASAEGYCGDWKATHWMPLPTPPQE